MLKVDFDKTRKWSVIGLMKLIICFSKLFHKWNWVVVLFPKKKVTDWCRQNVMRSKVGVATGEGIADLQKATVG